MPAGYESGLRIVEHYEGRDKVTKQVRGVFPTLTQAPEIDVGRVVRNATNRITGTAAQAANTISVHGVRPSARVVMDARPEDMILPLMSFFHNRKYTVITQGAGGPAAYTAPFTEVGTYEFGMPDGKPDNVGAIIGSYNPAAATYKQLVSMSDVYSVGLEYLYGHGDLGDVDNAAFIENFVANMIRFDVNRGVDQWLEFSFTGFGRTGDEVADVAEVSWGPGANGLHSAQPALTPEDAVINVLALNGVDILASWTTWFDGVTVEIGNGFDGRDPLGYEGLETIATGGRPYVTGAIRVVHVDGAFLAALKAGHKFELAVTFSSGVNEVLTITLPYLKFSESFTPTSPGNEGDVTAEIPFAGVVDVAITKPLAEVKLETSFDVRTNSFFKSNTLAAASTYIV